MKKLVLLTNNFPYSIGEDTFIVPELNALKKHFDIEIIRTSNEPIVKDHIKKFNLSDYKVTNYIHPPITFFTKIKNLFSCLFFKDYYKNVFSSKCSFKKFLLRESDCRNFYLEAKMFYKYLKKNKYFSDENIINTIYYSYWSNAALMAICMAKNKNKKIKIVCRAANYDLFNWRKKGGLQPFKKYMDKRIDKFYHVSKMGLDYYLDNFATDKNNNKYVLSYLGVGDNGINSYKNTKTINIVSCSYISAVKRVNLIIDELSMVKNIKINWTHFGGGELQEKMESYAQQKLTNNISYNFMGNTENQKIIAYYQNNSTDLFILLSSSEGLPVCIMEALSFGIPVIATKAGGVKEAINSKNGLLLPVEFKKGAVASFIEKYNEFSINDKKTMRSNARKTYLKKFKASQNFETFALSILEVFNNK